MLKTQVKTSTIYQTYDKMKRVIVGPLEKVTLLFTHFMDTQSGQLKAVGISILSISDPCVAARIYHHLV